MLDLKLEAKTPLDGYVQKFGDVTLSEKSGLSLVSIAIPLDGEQALNTAMMDSYGIPSPKVGEVTVSPPDGTQFLGLAQDQFLALFTEDNLFPVKTIKAKLGETAYYTDQSDSNVFLSIEGINSRKLLERICPLDLDPSVFAPGSVKRTVMEHLGVTIIHQSEDCYLLICARSFAQSFLDAVETSARNIS